MISTTLAYIIVALFITLFWIPVVLGWIKSIKKLIGGNHEKSHQHQGFKQYD
jgi:hypothetical protein